LTSRGETFEPSSQAAALVGVVIADKIYDRIVFENGDLR
jgi:hypothetical protein